MSLQNVIIMNVSMLNIFIILSSKASMYCAHIKTEGLEFLLLNFSLLQQPLNGCQAFITPLLHSIHYI